MINTSDFSLFDSMNAVELMDPKMDQCCGFDMSKKDDDLLNPKTLPDTININHVMKIIKKLISYEAAYLDGASVLETTHHCIYVWDKSWEHLELRISSLNLRKGKDDSEYIALECLLVYCQSLHASLWHASRIVLDADIYEDEDFSPQVSSNF